MYFIYKQAYAGLISMTH